MCLATLVMWIGAKSPSVLISDSLDIELAPYSVRSLIPFDVDGDGISDVPFMNEHKFLGFKWVSAWPNLNVTYYPSGYPSHVPPWPNLLIIPYWFAFLATSILPAWKTGALLRASRQHAAAYCRVCGYDLRASKGRCPECGTAMPEQLGTHR